MQALSDRNDPHFKIIPNGIQPFVLSIFSREIEIPPKKELI
jgi:hypothetical protein